MKGYVISNKLDLLHEFAIKAIERNEKVEAAIKIIEALENLPNYRPKRGGRA